eukprot:250048_1
MGTTPKDFFETMLTVTSFETDGSDNSKAKYAKVTAKCDLDDISPKASKPVYKSTPFVVTLILIMFIACIIATVFITKSIVENNQQSSNDDIKINCFNSNASNATHSDNTSFSNISIPKNLIIVISDGMGQTYNAAYRKYKNLTRTPMDKYLKGRYSTDPTQSDSITDSASGATVFACGIKTHNGFIGVDRYGNPMGSILAAAKRQGKGTGIIATKSVTDATPAAFSAHSLDRNFHILISKQQTMRQINDVPMLDVIMGGGRKYFEQWGFFDNTTMHKLHGWNTITKNSDEFLADLDNVDIEQLPYMGLFAYDKYPFYLDRINGYIRVNDSAPYPTLLQMTKKAINLLYTKYKNQGFFLMVEASQVDLCGHDNDIVCLLSEMEEFVETTQYIIDFAENNKETLVVMLADHETGGMTIGRDGSYLTKNLINYWDGKMPKDGNISKYWGSFEYDYSITSPKSISNNITNYGCYKWFPQKIKGSKHTASWFADQLEVNGSIQSVEQLYDELNNYYLGAGPNLSDLEKLFMNNTFDRDISTKKYAITQLMSVRTLTGWTTHSHTGSDVAVHAFGPNENLFFGHWHNDEIGKLLSKAFGVENQQNEETKYVQDLFVNGKLFVCDPSNKLTESTLYIEWNNTVEYPVGNLLHPHQKCVESWQ